MGCNIVCAQHNIMGDKYRTGGSFTKKILIDEDLIRHGYTLHFSEFYEYLLQMARESINELVGSAPFICTYFKILSAYMVYGKSIKINSDFDTYLHEYDIDRKALWSDICFYHENEKIDMNNFPESAILYKSDSIANYSEKYLKDHDEWDDIPSHVIENDIQFAITKSDSASDAVIEITIYFAAFSKTRDYISNRIPDPRFKFEKLQRRSSIYFDLLFDREIGKAHMLNLDRYELCNFIQREQLFDSEEAAKIIGKEFLLRMKKSLE